MSSDQPEDANDSKDGQEPEDPASNDFPELPEDAVNGPGVRDVFEHPELYPEEYKMLTSGLADTMRNFTETYSHVLSPTLDAIRNALPSASMSAAMLSQAQIPQLGQFARAISRQLDDVMKAAIPSIEMPRTTAAQMFGVTSARISQIAKALPPTGSTAAAGAVAMTAPSIPVRTITASTRSGRTEKDDLVRGLERLASLHERGALTDSEFTSAKARLLDRN